MQETISGWVVATVSSGRKDGTDSGVVSRPGLLKTFEKELRGVRASGIGSPRRGILTEADHIRVLIFSDRPRGEGHGARGYMIKADRVMSKRS